MLNNESVISESNKKWLFEWQCNDIEEKYDTVIKPAPGATAWLFHPKWIEWNKRVKLISIKAPYFNAPGWCASWTSMSKMLVFALEIAMLHETCKKK